MIEGWEKKTLGELCTVITKGTTPTSVGHSFIDEGINFVKIESISLDGKILPHKFAHISEEAHIVLKRSQLQEGDILFSIAGALGRTALVTNEILPANTNQALSIIRLKDESIISKEYLLSALSTGFTLEQVEKFKGGVAQLNLSLTQMKSFEIPIPTLKEQKQIVTTLDKAFKQIDQAKANLEKNLNNAKELFQSKLNEVFSQRGEGWEEKKLGDIASVEYGFTAKSTLEGTMRYVRITDINKKGNLILDEKKYIENTEESQKFQLKDNDILMARTGATFAKVLLYKDYEPSVFASYLIRIHFNENISNELYWYFSKSQFYWSQANSLSSGSAQPHFNGKALKEVMFSYPKSEKKQKELIIEFKSLLDEIEKLETHYQQKLNNLEELKKSILQKAFKGELDYA